MIDAKEFRKNMRKGQKDSNSKNHCPVLMSDIFRLRYQHLSQTGKAPKSLILNPSKAMVLRWHIQECHDCRDFYRTVDNVCQFMEMDILVREQQDPMAFHVEVRW